MNQCNILLSGIATQMHSLSRGQSETYLPEVKLWKFFVPSYFFRTRCNSLMISPLDGKHQPTLPSKKLLIIVRTSQRIQHSQYTKLTVSKNGHLLVIRKSFVVC